MIAKKFKLSRDQFPVKQRVAFRSPLFTVRLVSNHRLHNRYAVVISAHTQKKSVRRHFWKRRVYDILKTWPNWGYDIIITFSLGIHLATESSLRSQLEQARMLLSHI